jgi:hypothetical protein
MSYASGPVNYEIDAEHAVVYVTLSGAVTFASLCELDEAVMSDSRFRSDMSYYVDCRVLTEIPSVEQIRKLAIDRLLHGAESKLGKIAIVVLTRLGVEYATAWELFADSPNEDVQMFTAPEAARKWLGLPIGAGA